jgi:hypothetical protein
MRKKIAVDEELEEIFSHIQKLRQKQSFPDDLKQETPDPLKIIQENTSHVAGELNIDDIASGDVFQIISEVEKTPNEDLNSIGNLSTDISEEKGSIGVCDICHKGMIFERNLSGLVIHSKFFACEKCCINSSKKDLDIWTHSKNAKPEDVRPIAFWLMEKENKTRLIE